MATGNTSCLLSTQHRPLLLFPTLPGKLAPRSEVSARRGAGLAWDCRPAIAQRTEHSRLALTRVTAWDCRPASAQRTEHGRPVLTSATAETQTHVEEEEQEIEGLSRDYCTEFVCTSSPAVEQTVRALARDLTRLNTWTTSLFQKDVEYKDPLRSFRGVEKYKRLNYPYDNIKDPKVLVTKMQMVDMGVARISWRLRGSLAALPLDIDFVSEFELNLVTGRVRSHRERWDVSRMSFPARLAYNLSRIAWSAKQASLDTKEGGDKLLASLSLDEDDGDKDVLYRNPTDPTKFFQQDDNTMKDALALATIIAFLYLMVNAWTELAKL